MPLYKTGRQSVATKPEDLPVAVNNIHAFGGKAEKRMPRKLSISIYFFDRRHQKNLNQ